MLTSFKVSLQILALLTVAHSASAESHTVRFVNNCGKGTPKLIQNGNVLSNGSDYTINGPFPSAIAYLQTGNCGLNGEDCLLVETTLINPGAPGSGSSTDLSLIPPHAFSVPTGFEYYNGCDKTGAACDNKDCHGKAFFISSDTGVQVACQAIDVNLEITFC